jgi:hypothetical protein
MICRTQPVSLLCLNLKTLQPSSPSKIKKKKRLP